VQTAYETNEGIQPESAVDFKCADPYPSVPNALCSRLGDNRVIDPEEMAVRQRDSLAIKCALGCVSLKDD
jgi:hypothetical protein